VQIIETVTVDPGFLEGGGANSRQQSLGWRCTPMYRVLGVCLPPPPPPPQNK